MAFVQHLHCKINRADVAKKTFALRTKMIGVGEHAQFRYKAREFRTLYMAMASGEKGALCGWKKEAFGKAQAS